MAAAIGASSSLRVRASDSASATIALRASLVSRRAKAEHDLAALPAAERGAGEIRAEIDTLLISRKDLDPRGLGPCIDYVSNAARLVCIKVGQAKVELARATKREAVEAELRTVTVQLEQMPPSGAPANLDALAIVGYLELAGLKLDVEAVNKILVALTVMAIECGSGLAFVAVGALRSVGKTEPPAHPQEVPLAQLSDAAVQHPVDTKNSQVSDTSVNSR